MQNALLTDLCQLSMLQAYFDADMNDEAVFEFFVRKLPLKRNFLLAGGLEQALDYLEALRFEAEELDWMAGSGRFRADFVDSLADFRFTGRVEAMAEGTPFFADEPILRVVAPMREAQLVETRLINLLQFQTMIASKAVRSRLAAPDSLLVDFGLRRAHGAEAGLLSARASFISGFDGTATVLAGMRWGIPLYGTMAHSFIQACADERAAFRQFAYSHPRACNLLIDTYDTEAAAKDLVPIAQSMAREGIALQGVRIDSGDLGAHALRVRTILDAGGLTSMKIFASGNLDEDRVRALVSTGAPINGFGIGTRMNTSADQPYLDCAYKLQEYAGLAQRKRSEGKATWPGRKQIFRRFNDAGVMAGDTVTLITDQGVGVPLLETVMAGGQRLSASPALADIRAYCARQLAALPPGLRQLEPSYGYRVDTSPALLDLAADVDLRTATAAAMANHHQLHAIVA